MHVLEYSANPAFMSTPFLFKHSVKNGFGLGAKMYLLHFCCIFNVG